MECALCISIEQLSGRVRQATADVSRAPDSAVCERCGRALEGESGVRMAAKYAQLARFGLAGRPLFCRRGA